MHQPMCEQGQCQFWIESRRITAENTCIRLGVTLDIVNRYSDLIFIDSETDINHVSKEFWKRAHLLTELATYKLLLVTKTTEKIIFITN